MVQRINKGSNISTNSNSSMVEFRRRFSVPNETEQVDLNENNKSVNYEEMSYNELLNSLGYSSYDQLLESYGIPGYSEEITKEDLIKEAEFRVQRDKVFEQWRKSGLNKTVLTGGYLVSPLQRKVDDYKFKYDQELGGRILNTNNCSSTQTNTCSSSFSFSHSSICGTSSCSSRNTNACGSTYIVRNTNPCGRIFSKPNGNIYKPNTSLCGTTNICGRTPNRPNTNICGRTPNRPNTNPCGRFFSKPNGNLYKPNTNLCGTTNICGRTPSRPNTNICGRTPNRPNTNICGRKPVKPDYSEVLDNGKITNLCVNNSTNMNNSANYKNQKMAEYELQEKFKNFMESQKTNMCTSSLNQKTEILTTNSSEKYGEYDLKRGVDMDGAKYDIFTSQDGSEFVLSDRGPSYYTNRPISNVLNTENEQSDVSNGVIDVQSRPIKLSASEVDYQDRPIATDGIFDSNNEPSPQKSFSTESYTEMSNNGRTTDSPFAEQRVNYEQRTREKMMEKYNELKMENARIQGSPSAEQIAKYTEQAREKAMKEAMAQANNSPSAEQIAKYTEQAREKAMQDAMKKMK